MAEVNLAYGKGSVSVRVPEAITLEHRAPEPHDPAELLRDAVRGIRARDPVVVVLPDETRPIDREAALAALGAPLAGHEVEVLVGAGLHPAKPMSAPWPVRVHDATGPNLVSVGHALGIDVRVDAAVARAGTLIVVGAVTPHYLAGFSGGPKGIVPGVAAEQTILDAHARADTPRPGRIEDNPFAAVIRACAARVEAPTVFVHLLVGPRGPFDALAGSHEEAVDRYRAACAQPKPAHADVVVADAGGHPRDATLLQAHKAYEAAAQLARPGGKIILAAACRDGFGHPEFERRLFGATGDPHPYALTAAAWWHKARRFPTTLLTELATEALGVHATPPDLPEDARVLVAHAAQDFLFSDRAGSE